MTRATLAAVVAMAAIVTAGCRTCSSPYDYCGPVYSGGMCQACNPNYRAGSILSGGTADVPAQPTPMPQAQAASQPSADAPGAKRVLSVTDKKLESPAAMANE
jgi:hypothetical protein